MGEGANHCYNTNTTGPEPYQHSCVARQLITSQTHLTARNFNLSGHRRWSLLCLNQLADYMFGYLTNDTFQEDSMCVSICWIMNKLLFRIYRKSKIEFERNTFVLIGQYLSSLIIQRESGVCSVCMVEEHSGAPSVKRG